MSGQPNEQVRPRLPKDHPLRCASCGDQATTTILLEGFRTPVCLRHYNVWRTPTFEQARPEHEAESVTYFVELDDMGSADQYDTEQEARDALAQHGGYRVLKCVTYDLEVQP